MDLTDGEMGTLKRLLMAIIKKPDKFVVKPEDVGNLRSVLGKLEQPRLTIKERRELVRKVQEDGEKKTLGG